MKKTTKFTLAMIGVALLMIIGFVFAWNTNVETSDTSIREINNKISVLEEKMIINSNDWKKLEEQITGLKKEQKELNAKNNKLKNEKAKLEQQKKSLGLH